MARVVGYEVSDYLLGTEYLLLVVGRHVLVGDVHEALGECVPMPCEGVRTQGRERGGAVGACVVAQLADDAVV